MRKLSENRGIEHLISGQLRSNLIGITKSGYKHSCTLSNHSPWESSHSAAVYSYSASQFSKPGGLVFRLKDQGVILPEVDNVQSVGLTQACMQQAMWQNNRQGGRKPRQETEIVWKSGRELKGNKTAVWGHWEKERWNHRPEHFTAAAQDCTALVPERSRSHMR